MENNLLNEIHRLIASKREGQYWDFKEEWHKNNAELLHDIICLANALSKNNKYLIFGVSNPPSCKVLDIKNDPNRKTQANIIDFLRNKYFAGDLRPEIELHTLSLNYLDIDVLVIFNKPQKPYYLTKEYKDNGKIVRANHVYTRIIDTNTPIDKGADIFHIEHMWRERFGLDVTPLERLKLYLLDYDNWHWDQINFAYYKTFPEFTIKIYHGRESINKNVWWSHWLSDAPLMQSRYSFYYHTTTLTEMSVVHCDRENFSFPMPDVDYIQTDNSKSIDANNTYSFFYYLRNSFSYSLLFHLFQGKAEPIQSQIKPPIGILPFPHFEDKAEKDLFKGFIEDHLVEFFKETQQYPRKMHGKDILEEEEKFAYWAYEQFRKSKTKKG